MNRGEEEKEVRKKSFSEIFTKYTLIFMEFSFMGWIYEVTLAFIYGFGFVNRGFLFGPFLPIYGFGGVLLYLCLGRVMDKKFKIGRLPVTGLLVFLAIVVITTTTELIGGLIINHLNLPPLWDYTGYKFNFHGLIAPNPSIRFGLGGIFMLYVLLPFFNKLINKIPKKLQTAIAILLFVVLLIDFGLTIYRKSMV